MGQQSNKVQKRRRRLNYNKRKKITLKTAAPAAKTGAASKPTGTAAKKAAASKPAPAAAKPTPAADLPKTAEKPVAAFQPEPADNEALHPVKE
jgi:hypothetical protein